MVDAFSDAAQRITLARADRQGTKWRRDSIRREVWIVGDKVETDETVAVAGRLEAVDVAVSRFRIRDDVGNKITLTDVVDPDRVGGLVGQRAIATGTAVRGPRGQIVSVTRPVIEPHEIPAEWLSGPHVGLESLVASAPGPDPDGGVDLTDEEFDDFMAILCEF